VPQVDERSRLMSSAADIATNLISPSKPPRVGADGTSKGRGE